MKLETYIKKTEDASKDFQEIATKSESLKLELSNCYKTEQEFGISDTKRIERLSKEIQDLEDEKEKRFLKLRKRFDLIKKKQSNDKKL
jgi:hypothetical protein